jgi:hypothetical protein
MMKHQTETNPALSSPKSQNYVSPCIRVYETDMADCLLQTVSGGNSNSNSVVTTPTDNTSDDNNDGRGTGLTSSPW